jgi:hypothetical protein
MIFTKNSMHKVTIIDDVVDKETQDLIEATVFGKTTKWTFARSVFDDGFNPEVNEEQRNKLMSFTNLIYDEGEMNPNGDLYFKVIAGLNIKQLLQIRIQLQLPVITEIDKIHGVPHVDGYTDIPYKVGVYYVNDSDGDTVLFKQTTDDTTPVDVMNGKLDIDQTLSPKKGRLIIFDSNIYHAVGKPKKNVRSVLNYHFR